ncbi:MAG: response regulator [Rhodospirillales bacterium]|nr:response regulator [Rhodospirillales bacterium]
MRSHSAWIAFGVAASIGVVYWIVDGIVGYLTYRDHVREILFLEPVDIWDSLFLRIPSPHLTYRVSVLLVCLAGGLVVAYLLRRWEESNTARMESEARFRFMANAAPMAIATKNLDREFTWANEEMLRRCRMTPEQIRGKTSQDLQAPDIAREVDALEDAALESGQPKMRQMQTQLPDGVARTELIIRFPILDQDGAAIGIGGMGMDVSEQRSIERQLLQAQKMEVVGQLTGGIAHDFNNLLQVIETSLDLVRKQFPEDDGMRKLVENAFNAGRRGAKLTQQLLTFSRKQTLSPDVLDPSQVIEGMLKLLGRTLGEDIRIETRLEADPWPVMADSNGLENAIFNLVLNARAAMPDGGTLILGIANVELGLGTVMAGDASPMPPGDYVEIAISDSGHGMTDVELSRAFEPFFTTKDVGEGSGLGLSMVYGFARQSDGIATLESATGEGTTARILLPRAEKRRREMAEPDMPVMTSDKKGKILVVEDDPVVRESAVMLMESFGYTALEAENAMAALAVIDSEPDVNLMITDMVMPGDMNGLELAREAARRKAALKTVIVTGYAESDLRNKGLADSGFKLLSKPFTAEQLDTLLTSVFKE